MVDSDQKKRILKASACLFLERGFSKVTMDEIASDLGMSKKTIYKYFENKHILIKETLTDMFIDLEKKVQKIIYKPELNVVEKLGGIFQVLFSRFTSVKKHTISDLRKNYPELWYMIEKYRREKILKKFEVIFMEGQDSGLIRKDINIDLLSVMLIKMVEGVGSPDVIVNFALTPSEIITSVWGILLKGIVSEKGEEHVREGLFINDEDKKGV